MRRPVGRAGVGSDISRGDSENDCAEEGCEIGGVVAVVVGGKGIDEITIGVDSGADAGRRRGVSDWPAEWCALL